VEDVVPRHYPAEFRRKVLDLVAAGRPVAQVAGDRQISAQAIYARRRQQLIDSGQMPGLTSSDQAELVAAHERAQQIGVASACGQGQTAKLVILPLDLRLAAFSGPPADGRNRL
jgi:transposase-like protein